MCMEEENACDMIDPSVCLPGLDVRVVVTMCQRKSFGSFQQHIRDQSAAAFRVSYSFFVVKIAT